jgi:hypothetical protein
MVGPAGDAVEPGLEETELGVPELIRHLFQHKDSKHFFLENAASKKLVSDLDEEGKALFLNNRAPEADGNPAQLGRVPAPRFDFFFEKPLDALGVRRGATIFENTADVIGDVFRRDSAFRHIQRAKAYT